MAEAVKRTRDEDQQSYLDGYERDLLAGERRLAEAEEAGNDHLAEQARAQIANAKRLLKAYGVDHGEKRPAGRAKETRA